MLFGFSTHHFHNHLYTYFFKWNRITFNVPNDSFWYLYKQLLTYLWSLLAHSDFFLVQPHSLTRTHTPTAFCARLLFFSPSLLRAHANISHSYAQLHSLTCTHSVTRFNRSTCGDGQWRSWLSVFFFTITSHVVRISAWGREQGGKVGHTVSRNFDCHSVVRALKACISVSVSCIEVAKKCALSCYFFIINGPFDRYIVIAIDFGIFMEEFVFFTEFFFVQMKVKKFLSVWTSRAEIEDFSLILTKTEYRGSLIQWIINCLDCIVIAVKYILAPNILQFLYYIFRFVPNLTNIITTVDFHYSVNEISKCFV